MRGNLTIVKNITIWIALVVRNLMPSPGFSRVYHAVHKSGFDTLIPKCSLIQLKLSRRVMLIYWSRDRLPTGEALHVFLSCLIFVKQFCMQTCQEHLRFYQVKEVRSRQNKHIRCYLIALGCKIINNWTTSISTLVSILCVGYVQQIWNEHFLL